MASDTHTYYLDTDSGEIMQLRNGVNLPIPEGCYRLAMPLRIYKDGKLCTVDGETDKAPVR